MSKLEEIVDDYYEAIQEYENYLKDRENKIEINNLSSIEKNLMQIFREEYEEGCMPWRKIKGDIKNKLYYIFSTKNIDKIKSYLRAEDELGDALTTSAEQDLIKFYSKNGYDINDDMISDEISEEASQISFKDNIDTNIYSKETIRLLLIDKKFTKACDELYKYCTGYYDEVEKQLEVNEEKVM